LAARIRTDVHHAVLAEREDDLAPYRGVRAVSSRGLAHVVEDHYLARLEGFPRQATVARIGRHLSEEFDCGVAHCDRAQYVLGVVVQPAAVEMETEDVAGGAHCLRGDLLSVRRLEEVSGRRVQLVECPLAGSDGSSLAVSLGVVKSHDESDKGSARGRVENDEPLVCHPRTVCLLIEYREDRTDAQNVDTDGTPRPDAARVGGLELNPPQPDAPERHPDAHEYRKEDAEDERQERLVFPHGVNKV
jgi:hypothetical protein